MGGDDRVWLESGRSPGIGLWIREYSLQVHSSLESASLMIQVGWEWSWYYTYCRKESMTWSDEICPGSCNSLLTFIDNRFSLPKLFEQIHFLNVLIIFGVWCVLRSFQDKREESPHITFNRYSKAEFIFLSVCICVTIDSVHERNT